VCFVFGVFSPFCLLNLMKRSSPAFLRKKTQQAYIKLVKENIIGGILDMLHWVSWADYIRYIGLTPYVGTQCAMWYYSYLL